MESDAVALSKLANNETLTKFTSKKDDDNSIEVRKQAPTKVQNPIPDGTISIRAVNNSHKDPPREAPGSRT